MFKKVLATCAGVIALMVVLISITTAAFAQTPQCAPYPLLSEHLTGQYEEAIIWQGQASSDAMIQLWANGKSQTWTLVAMSADGTGCMIASGRGSETFASPPAGTEG